MKFRLLTMVCIAYWAILLIKLFLRQDLEMADSFSFIIYSFFLTVHIFILVGTYVSDRYQKGQSFIYKISVIPFVLTGSIALISLLSFLAFALKSLFG